MIRATKRVTAIGSRIEHTMTTWRAIVVFPPGGGWPFVAIVEKAVQRLLGGSSDSPSDFDQERDLSWNLEKGSNLYDGPGIDGSPSHLQPCRSLPSRAQDCAELSVASVSVIPISSTTRPGT